MSWGKVDPSQLPNAVVCYVDSTIGFPILAAYALSKRAPRPPRRLYERREELLDSLRKAYLAARDFRDERTRGSALPGVDDE